MNKLVVVINGTGGVGKDTLCDIVSRHYKVMNTSAIDPIKDVARQYGWNGEKDKRSRKFLSDLKQAFIGYNDLPLNYLLEECRRFMISDKDVLFVHIREPFEIEKFKNECPTKCVTLLIRRDAMKPQWNNKSDDDVENYNYDFCYDNNKPLKDVEEDFIKFFNNMLYIAGQVQYIF